MIISNITPPQVWSASARSLTNFGSGALTSGSIVKTTIAANAAVDLRSSAGIVGMVTLNVSTGSGATGACSIKLLDGANNPNIVASSAGSLQTCAFTLVSTSAVGPQAVNSDASVAGSYMTATMLYTI